MGFDANGNVAGRTDWNGNLTNYGYDLARNLETSRVEASGSPQARTISTQWHSTFRLPAQIAEPLRITAFTYDGAGNPLTRSVQATTDANGSLAFAATPAGSPRVWTYTYTYNANGQVLTADGPRTDVSDVTTYTYDAQGNVTAVTNAAGHTTSITSHNVHGQPLTIIDSNGLTTTLAYDLRQRLTSRSVGGEITSYDYDPAGQLTRVTLPDGSFLSYSYDDAHRLTGIADNLGNRIAYTLDLAGNRTQEQVFDPSNALAQTRSRVYSSLNRLFQELGATGQTTEYAYDNQGNVSSVKDPLNRITANQYDPLNRLKQVTDPATGVTLYGYNGQDALTQVTDPRNLVTGYTMDGLGNLSQQVSPDTGTTVNSYDVAGNLLTQTDAKGQVTSYAYDALNRVTLITFHDGSKQAYAYDAGSNSIGRLLSITETNPALQVTSVLAYAYDAKGRVTSETRTVGGVPYVLAYQYDSSGRLAGLTYPSGRSVSYAFDALGRISQVASAKDGPAQVVVQNVQYHPFGGASGFTLGNGQAHVKSRDQDGRIASYSLGAQFYAVGYDAASRITFVSETTNPANSNTYGYDSLDRLTSAVLPATAYAYNYDAVGNRLSRTAGTATDSYTYGSSSNRIATLTPASGPPRNFVFDANGSTTNDALNTYVYDVRGRMVQATSVAGTTNYQVNALGQRIRKTNASGDTVFTYDTWGKLIAESAPNGAIKREYLYLGDTPVALANPGAAGGGAEIVIDNGSPSFATTGTWPVSAAVPGYVGSNYQTHAANGPSPSGVSVDNTDAGFSVTGSWPASTAVSGHLGANYQVHEANGPPPSGVVADNTSGSATGTWPASTSVSGYLGTNYQTHAAGTGSSVFTWSPSIATAGSYQVYARWTQHANRASNAKYTVNHAAGSDVVTVSQQANGGSWQLLGSYSFNAGTTTVSLSDDANGYVIADAVILVPPGAAPSTAIWTVNVPGAGSYSVYARWTQHANRATNATYTVNHAGGAATVTANQQSGGGTWNLLGTYSFNAGNTTVSLTDQANGYVVADAVMLVPPGAQANTATWTPNVPAAGTYNVYARWTQHANRATNATYTVVHAGGTAPVSVNQQANGGVWNSLGSFNLSPGTAHKITLTDQANGYVIADAIRLVPISIPTAPSYFYVHSDHLNTPRLVANDQQQAVWSRPPQEPFGVSPPDENPSGLGVFPFPLRESNYYDDKETGTFYAMLRDGYDPAKGRFDQFDPIGLAGGSMSPYTYVANSPLRFTDPLGLATYMCTRRLNNVPFRAGPLYHQFICVGNAKGGFTCGGLGPSTSNIFNTPGIIESDTMKSQSCQLVQDDNDCVEQCIKDTFGKPPPNYSVDLSRGENCQTYADAAVFDCVARCKTRKK